MLVSFPHVKALTTLALAAFVAAAAMLLVGISMGTARDVRDVKGTTAVSGTATPGSTAHARSVYRASLGR